MQTYTGRAFFPLDPRPEDIHIVDIAHALAHQSRFNGHCRRFYSIAEHCVRAARLVPAPLAFTALLHDAAEAYTGDMVLPLKMLLPDFRSVEELIERAVGEKFGVELASTHPDVKRADRRMLAWERRDLMGASTLEWDRIEEVAVTDLPKLRPWGPLRAKLQFLSAFTALQARQIVRSGWAL